MRGNFRRLIGDRSGVTAIEYAVLMSLLAMAIIIGAALSGTNLNQTFVAIDAAISSSLGGSGTLGGSGGGDHHDHDGH